MSETVPQKETWLAPVPTARKTYTNLWFGPIHQADPQTASAASDDDLYTTTTQAGGAGHAASPVPKEARSFAEIRSLFASALLASRPKRATDEEIRAVRWAQTTMEELKRRLYQTALSLSTEPVPDYIQSPYKQLVVPIPVKAEFTPFLTDLQLFFEDVLFDSGFNAIVATKFDGDIKFLEVSIGFDRNKGGIQKELWRLKEEIIGPTRGKGLSKESTVKYGLWEAESLPVDGLAVNTAAGSLPTPVASSAGGDTEPTTPIDKYGENMTTDENRSRMATPDDENGGARLYDDERIDPKLRNGAVIDPKLRDHAVVWLTDSDGDVELPDIEQQRERKGTLESEDMELDSNPPTGGIASPSPQRLQSVVPYIIISDSEDEIEQVAPQRLFATLRPLSAERKQALLRERIAETGYANS